METKNWRTTLAYRIVFPKTCGNAPRYRRSGSLPETSPWKWTIATPPATPGGWSSPVTAFPYGIVGLLIYFDLNDQRFFVTILVNELNFYVLNIHLIEEVWYFTRIEGMNLYLTITINLTFVAGRNILA